MIAYYRYLAGSVLFYHIILEPIGGAILCIFRCYTPTLYKMCHGIFIDHRKSGPQFNVSSEETCSVSAAPCGYIVYNVFLRFDLKTNYPRTYIAYIVHVCDTIQNGARVTRRRQLVK